MAYFLPAGVRRVTNGVDTDWLPILFLPLLPWIKQYAHCSTDDAAPPTGGPDCADAAWINEFHYDNSGGDVGEFVEVVLASGLTPADYDLVFYNGSNGSEYRTENLGSATSTTDATSGFQILLQLPSNGIQNGSPDGIALVDVGTVVEFISYEGTFTATDGPASGMMSTNIGVSETSEAHLWAEPSKNGYW